MASTRIHLTENRFAKLLDEVDNLCPLCSARLLIERDGKLVKIAEGAHIYPHSPTSDEKKELEGVPLLADDVESLDNIILLCPNCHTKFDKPRVREEYLRLYRIKQAIITQRKAQEYYQVHDLETEIVEVLRTVTTMPISTDEHQLSYDAIKAGEKMSHGASEIIKHTVIKDIRSHYVTIQNALKQLECDHPNISTMLAKQVGLYYLRLKKEGLSQDETYYAINDWINQKTNYQYKMASQYITAFYIQDCEVFTK